jgi:quercetin dioxygenase-like cupin family protein
MSTNGKATLDNKITVKESAWVSSGYQNINIEGPALVIDNPGYEFSEKKTCTFNPSLQGQLSYIDGCSNSNLIDPPRNGDPCINYLYFPPGIDQTWHTHPSVRIGYVLSGQGYACLKYGDKEEELSLELGKIFVLHRHVKHRFRTNGDQHMSLMVYHPDSEDGPRDENNPMKSRTYIR